MLPTITKLIHNNKEYTLEALCRVQMQLKPPVNTNFFVNKLFVRVKTI